MASNIKFKRSAVQNRVPTTAQLDLGELALNTYDGKLYTEINTGSAAVVEIGSKLSSLVVDGDNGAGGGDVVFHGVTASRDLTWDYSHNTLSLADNVLLGLGNSNDLLIHHTGQTGYIKGQNGNLYIQSDQVIVIGNQTASTVGVKYTNGAAVDLYHNNSLRVSTTTDGLDVFGTGSLKVPVGTTAQRNSSPAAGDIRYNSTLGSFEGYSSSWGELGGGGIGIGSTSTNPASGVVVNRIGVGFTDINVVGTGISVTGYGSTIVLDFNDFKPGSFNRSIHNYTATAGQTTFAGLNYNNSTKQIAVYLNGARLSADTYTATSGTTVVLDVGASVGDEVEIINIHINSDVDRKVNNYTATAGQTTFTGLSYNSSTELDVYLNGIRLASADYTATSGNTVVLAVGASVNDIVDIVSTGDGVSFRSTADTSGDKFTLTNVGIGTDITPDKLNVRGNVNIVGVLTATTLHGDGSNLTNTGSTLSEPSSGTQRLVTTSLTTGTMTSSGTGSELAFDYSNNHLEFSDSTRATFGTGNDLQVVHTGVYSLIQNYTGELKIAANQLRLVNKDTDETYITADDNGSVQIYHNNDLAFSTQADGISAHGREGNNANIYLFADEADDLPDQWRIRALAASSTLEIQNRNTNALYDTNLVCKGDGAVELYHDNVKKFETRSGGATITGGLICGGATFSGNVNVPDNYLLSLGSSNDLQLYHNGSNSYISNRGAGALVLESTTGEAGIILTQNGSVQLRHDNSQKFDTTAYGTNTTGTAVNDGMVVAGVTTTSDDIKINADNKKLQIGASQDLYLWHNGSTGNSNISNVTGDLFIQGHNGSGTAVNQIAVRANAAVELNYQGSKKFETTSTGASINGNLAVSGVLTYEDVTSIDAVGIVTAQQGIHVTSGNIEMQTAGNIILGDSGGATDDRISIGAGGDLHIYHDGTDSYVSNATGDLKLFSVGGSADDVTIRAQDDIQLQPDNGDNGVNIIGNGAVELYHDNSKRLETTSSGVSVTGNVACSELRPTSHLVMNNADNQIIYLGAGNDLQIYHDGSHSYINENGTGQLRILTNGFRLNNAANTENIIVADGDGAVELYHDNAKKVETFANGIIVYGPEAGGGLVNIYADEGDDNADKWRLHANPNGSFYLQNYSQGSWHNSLAAAGGGAISLYHNNVVKLATKSDGVDITGELQCDSLDVDGDSAFDGAVDLNQTVRFNSAGYNFNINRDGSDRINFAWNDGSGTREWALYHEASGDLNFYRNAGSGNFEVTGPANFTGGHFAFNPNGYQMKFNTDGLRSIFQFERNGSAVMYFDHAANSQHFNFDFASSSGAEIQIEGSKILTTATGVQRDGNNNGAVTINAQDEDFIVQDATDSTTNFIWRDHSDSKLYLGTGSAVVTARSHVLPAANDTYNLGANGVRWANVYVNDLQLSNESKKDTGGNDVDGTWGDWTLQEGESEVFMINNRTGKKYAMMLREVS